MEKEKHAGSQVKRRTFPALVAVLILALLAVGTWTTVGVAGDGTPRPSISGTGQTGGKNATSDNGDLPAARPASSRPTSGRARPRGRHQENGEPGPLVTETACRQALPEVGLISVICAVCVAWPVPGRPIPRTKTSPGRSGRVDRRTVAVLDRCLGNDGKPPLGQAACVEISAWVTQQTLIAPSRP